jgi:hypothetical protein
MAQILGVNVHGVLLYLRSTADHGLKKSGKSSTLPDRRHGGFRPSIRLMRDQGCCPRINPPVAIEVAGANIFVNAIAAGGILTPADGSY